MKVRNGQLWRGTGRRSHRLVRVVAIVRPGMQRPYAAVESLQHGRLSRISLDRLNPHCGWRLANESETASAPNPVDTPAAS